MCKGEKKTALSAQMLHFVGLTLILGLGGGLAAVFGKRRFAGILWAMLGAGSMGAAFARSTRETLRFDQLHPLSEQETYFLATHLPFLVIGLLMLYINPRGNHSVLSN